MNSYIWPLPTRLFHWLLAVAFVVCYILADFENLLNYHFAFGALVGGLIFFRLLYGIFGPRYSHFRDFPIGIRHQFEFIKTFFGKTKVYAGHNPAAALVMLSIFIVGIGSAVTGYLLYASENNVLNLNFDKEIFKEAHEIVANIFLALVILHLIGIVVDLIFHAKNETLKSIFTGYKNIEVTNVKQNILQKAFSVIWIIAPFFLFYIAYGFLIRKQGDQNSKSIKTEQHEDKDDD
jgi:cytochrome b